ncbi:MAG: hypothetical protein HQL64_17460, partial [Magnetococcales bacterium]|nr:hypothetical protein [Magnetococcales bacterium]
MATFNIRRFAHPDSLKSINPVRLVDFLRPHAEFLSGQGIPLSGNGSEPVDYECLASVLMNLEPNAPQVLLESLYLIHEMATDDGMDRLLDAAKAHGLALDHDPDSCPADIAIQMFLTNRDLLERQHANTFISRARSFQYFCGREGWNGSFSPPDDATLRALEKEMDYWFDEKRRGRGSRVFVFNHGHKVNLVIRHGMPFKREGSIRDGKSGSIYYRPECHDVLVYDRNVNELCIKAGSKGEREMYLLQVGRHLFGNDSHFPGTEKYTLQPLLDDGAESLACDDVEGIEWILLREIAIYRGGKYSETDIRKSKNIFESFTERNYTLSPKLRLNM